MIERQGRVLSIELSFPKSKTNEGVNKLSFARVIQQPAGVRNACAPEKFFFFFFRPCFGHFVVASCYIRAVQVVITEVSKIVEVARGGVVSLAGGSTSFVCAFLPLGYDS
jgi:hypothetical protein